MSVEVIGEAELERLICSLSESLVDDLGQDFSMVGIVTGGAQLAKKMSAHISKKYGFVPRLGSIDITLYRDDLYSGLERPALGANHISFPIDGSPLVLVDDVLFTGRTVRAALQELNDLGRPSLVKLAVLIDRGHRELPIQADYVGQVIQTHKRDRIEIRLGDDENSIYLHGRTDGI